MNYDDIEWGNRELEGLPDDELFDLDARKLAAQTSMIELRDRLHKEGKHKKILSKAGKKGGLSNVKNKKGFFDPKNKEKILKGCSNGGKAVIDKLIQHNKKYYSKPILVYDYKTGELVGEYSGKNEMCRILNLSKMGVYDTMNGRQNQHKGYTFKYKN